MDAGIRAGLLESASLLGVFAHPDDESLAAGGLFARVAAAGSRTTVVTATWAIGTERAAELGRALAILGAGTPRLLGYADTGAPQSAPGELPLTDAPLDEAVCRLVVHLRDVRPDVVVTHDACGGLTGHPDHLRTHLITALAVTAAGDPLVRPDLGEPWSPRGLYLATHPERAMPAFREVFAERRRLYATPDDVNVVEVDVTPWLEKKLAAIRAHRTEVERGALPGRMTALDATHQRRLLGTEWYTRPGAAPAVE